MVQQMALAGRPWRLGKEGIATSIRLGQISIARWTEIDAETSLSRVASVLRQSERGISTLVP